MKKLIIIPFLILSVLILSGCSAFTGLQTTTIATPEKTYKIKAQSNEAVTYKEGEDGTVEFSIDRKKTEKGILDKMIEVMSLKVTKDMMEDD